MAFDADEIKGKNENRNGAKLAITFIAITAVLTILFLLFREPVSDIVNKISPSVSQTQEPIEPKTISEYITEYKEADIEAGVPIIQVSGDIVYEDVQLQETPVTGETPEVDDVWVDVEGDTMSGNLEFDGANIKLGENSILTEDKAISSSELEVIDEGVWFSELRGFLRDTQVDDGAIDLDSSEVEGVLPIIYGGTNASNFDSDRFIWFDGTRLVASNFSESSFLPVGTDNWVNEAGDAMTGSLIFSGVASDISSASGQSLILSAPGSQHIVFNSGGGNVGINTNEPTNTLQVRDTVGTPMIEAYNPTGSAYIGVDSDGSGASGFAFQRGGSPLWYLMESSGEIGLFDVAAGTRRLSVLPTGEVGVGVGSPVENLELSGALRVGTTTNTNAGTIRWTGADFEGYDGGSWLSLTTPAPVDVWVDVAGDTMTGALVMNGANINIGTNSIVTGATTVQSTELDILDGGVNFTELSGQLGDAQISAGAVDLDTTEVAGTLPIARGGTNATTFSATTEFIWYNGTSLVVSGYDETDFMPAGTDNWVNVTGDTMTGSLQFSGVTTDIYTPSGENLRLNAQGSGDIELITGTGGVIGIGTTSSPPSIELSTITSTNGADDLLVRSSGTDDATYFRVSPNGTPPSSYIWSTVQVFGTDWAADQTNLESVEMRFNADASGDPGLQSIFQINTYAAGTGTLHPLAITVDDGVTEGLFIDTDSDVGIGTTSPTGAAGSHDLEVTGGIRVGTLDAATSTQLCIDGDGDLSSCTASSIRYKDNVSDLDLGLGTVMKLNSVGFNWKSSGERDIGFIAEEVEKVDPLMVVYNRDGQVDGVKYDKLSAVLVNAIQEQQGMINRLQVDVNKMDGLRVQSNGSYLSQDYLTTDSTLVAGDVVSIDQNAKYVTRTTKYYDKNAIGVVNTSYADVMHAGESSVYKPVTVGGRTPVKVSTENGDIRKGDYLVPSKTPGYAMRACGDIYCKEGSVIGTALEDFDSSKAGDTSLVHQELSNSVSELEKLKAYLSDSKFNSIFNRISSLNAPLSVGSGFGRIVMLSDQTWYDPRLEVVGKETHKEPLEYKIVETPQVLGTQDKVEVDPNEVLQAEGGIVALGRSTFEDVYISRSLDIVGEVTIRGKLQVVSEGGIEFVLADALGNDAFEIKNIKGSTVFSVDSTGNVAKAGAEVVYFNNSSGISLRVGQVVVLDRSNQDSVKLTNLFEDSDVIGVVVKDAAANQRVEVAIGGKVDVGYLGEVKVGDEVVTSIETGKVIVTQKPSQQDAVIGKVVAVVGDMVTILITK